MVDIARLGLAVDSSQVEKGTVTLNQLTGAAGAAERATRGLAAGANAEAVAQRTATAATAAHTAALSTQNAIMRSNAAQRTMMIFQLNDIAVSLASGMNPAMVAMQQGSQILQGGLMPAIRTLIDLGKGFVTTFWPVAAVIGVVAAGVAGLTYEINKTADVQVGFFDVALAGWQLLAEQIAAVVGPVFAQLGVWLQQAWDTMAPILKTAGNAIIGTFVGAFEATRATWAALPGAIADVVLTTANVMIKGIQHAINGAAQLLDNFINKANEGLGQFGVAIPNVGRVEFGGFANPYAGQATAAAGEFGDAFTGAMGRDYLGSAFSALSERAQAIALARKETEEAGSAAEAANQKFKKLAEDGLTSVAERADAVVKGLTDAFKGIGSELFGILKEGGDIASKALDLVLSKLEQFAMSWLDNIVNTGLDSLFGSLFGGRGFGTGMFGVSSVTPLGFGGTAGIYGVPSFAGGGYTWDGPRSGGVDGQGGRLALLHPRETVVDHTRMAANSNTPSIKNELHIHPPAGFETRTEESETEGGMRTDVFFDRAVAGAINRPGSQSARAAANIGRVVRR